MRTTPRKLILLMLALLIASCAQRKESFRAAVPTAVTVEATWGKTSPTAAAEQLAKPLEHELAAISGVYRTVTHCDSGGCRILLQHDPNVPADKVAFAANAVVKRLKDALPQDATVSVYASNTGRAPDFVVALMLDAPDVAAEHHATALQFAADLLRLPTVEKCDVPGGPKEETNIVINQQRAASHGLTLPDVAEAIKRAKTQTIRTNERTTVTVRQSDGPADVGSVVLKTVGNAAIRIEDVADVKKVTTPGAVVHVNGRPAVLVHVFVRSGASSDEVGACLRRVLEQRPPAGASRIVPIGMNRGWWAQPLR